MTQAKARSGAITSTIQSLNQFSLAAAYLAITEDANSTQNTWALAYLIFNIALITSNTCHIAVRVTFARQHCAQQNQAGNSRQQSLLNNDDAIDLEKQHNTKVGYAVLALGLVSNTLLCARGLSAALQQNSLTSSLLMIGGTSFLSTEHITARCHRDDSASPQINFSRTTNAITALAALLATITSIAAVLTDCVNIPINQTASNKDVRAAHILPTITWALSASTLLAKSIYHCYQNHPHTEQQPTMRA